MKVKVASSQYPILYHHSVDEWKKRVTAHTFAGSDHNARLLLFPEYGSMELVSLLPAAVQKDLKLQIREMQGFHEVFTEHYASLARELDVIIVAPSFPVLENDKIYNRAYVFAPSGRSGYQDKWFMTRFENEEWLISPGKKELSVFQADFGRFGIQICYDIEFPVGTNHLANAGAEIILVPSCTETIRGATRVHTGARARAMEYQCYTVVSQTVGEALWTPAVDINYGYAAFYSTPDRDLPEEGIIGRMKAGEQAWLIKELDPGLLKKVRTEGQVFNFRDHGSIRMDMAEEEIVINYVDLR